MMKNKIKLAVAASALASLPASAAISILAVGTGGDAVTTAAFTVAFDATGADKLVVVVTGEHGFNNDQGQVNTLTYDGVALVAVPGAYRTAVAGSTDTLYNGIFYLDAPVTTGGVISANTATRGVITAYALTGTAPGAGNGAIGTTGTRTIDLDATAGSLVIASYGVGGAGNGGNVTGIDTDGSLVEQSAVSEGSNWDGHVTGSQAVTTTGTDSYAFTGGTAAGGFVVAAEFTAIPEPSSTLLLSLAGFGALGFRRRK